MKKEIMKRLPFTEINIPGIEAWLDQMALEGYFLIDTAGTSWYFVEGEPKNIRYRLDAVTEKGAMPSLEKREDYQAMGWNYVLTHRRMYHIFRADNPNTAELHSDGLVESLSLKQLEKSLGTDLIVVAITVLFWFLFSMRTGHGLFKYPVLTLMTPDLRFIFMLFWSAGCIWNGYVSYQEIKKMRVCIAEGRTRELETKPLAAYPNEKFRRYYMPVCFLIYIALSFLFRPYSAGIDEVLLTEKLPVLEVLETGEVRKKPAWFLDSDINYYKKRKNLLSENYELHETREVLDEGEGEGIETSISGYYFEPVFAPLAEILYRDAVKKYAGLSGAELENHQISDTGFDSCIFTEADGKQVLAVLDGKKILVLEYEGQSDLREKTEVIKNVLESRE
ncbi:DUF2812 domain-containing protein [Clostridium transplantifaecale]|uniref:DUF2812 domain-containing protein n=1 Tax=Clostridium transplantifaecale TaxID=2479838 RepID=UPI000F6379E6|nr:DUF2812 domain-containing protein [Clostridium transplantifaecale]